MEHSVKTKVIFGLLSAVLCLSGNAYTAEDLAPKKDFISFERRDTSFYSTFFKDQLYNPTLGLLEPLRLLRAITFSKPSALDINRYDEVVDGSFFANRHGKQTLSIEALTAAPLASADPGPNPKGPWKVLKGKTDGVTPGFFIQDANGDKFLLKFDPRSNPEMTTSAEMIGHKFFYAIGYNVPSYSVVTFSPDILEVDPKATYYNKQGFKHPLTKEKVLEMLEKDAPIFAGKKYRASASRILPGKLAGYFEYDEKNAKETGDLIPHDRLRVLRALRVFGSWINNYDLHRKNTMTTVVAEDGKESIKHYLIDFGSSLGSAAYRPKVPAVGFENIVDFDEAAKAALTLKSQTKPWEKRWDSNSQVITHTNLGYFDNREFDPGHWKSNLPHFAFDYMTNADAYWAAKIISEFRDDEIKAIVKTGKVSDPKAEKLLAGVLIERRDIIAKHWFEKVSPLENFSLKPSGGGLHISFTDLSAEKGWVKDRLYVAKIYSVHGKKLKLVRQDSSDKPSFLLPLPSGERGLIRISVVHPGKKRPFVNILFENRDPYKILTIEH